MDNSCECSTEGHEKLPSLHTKLGAHLLHHTLNCILVPLPSAPEGSDEQINEIPRSFQYLHRLTAQSRWTGPKGTNFIAYSGEAGEIFGKNSEYLFQGITTVMGPELFRKVWKSVLEVPYGSTYPNVMGAGETRSRVNSLTSSSTVRISRWSVVDQPRKAR